MSSLSLQYSPFALGVHSSPSDPTELIQCTPHTPELTHTHAPKFAITHTPTRPIHPPPPAHPAQEEAAQQAVPAELLGPQPGDAGGRDPRHPGLRPGAPAAVRPDPGRRTPPPPLGGRAAGRGPGAFSEPPAAAAPALGVVRCGGRSRRCHRRRPGRPPAGAAREEAAGLGEPLGEPPGPRGWGWDWDWGDVPSARGSIECGGTQCASIIRNTVRNIIRNTVRNTVRNIVRISIRIIGIRIIRTSNFCVRNITGRGL